MPKFKLIESPDKKDVYGYTDGLVFYWAQDISETKIKEEEFFKKAENFITAVLYLFGIAGIVCLLVKLFFNLYSGADFLGILFEPSILILIFWFSIFNDMYLYYFVEKNKKEKNKMPQRAFGEEIKDINEDDDILNWENLDSLQDKQKINIANYFTAYLNDALKKSYLFAKGNKQHEVTSLDLGAAVLEEGDVKILFNRLQIDTSEFIKKIARAINAKFSDTATDTDLYFDVSAKKALLTAFYESYSNRRPEISSAELLLGLVKTNETLLNIFDDLEVELKKIENVCQWIYLEKKLINWSKEYQQKSKNKPKTFMNRSMTARPTKNLDKYSQDFTLKARSGNFFPLIGREKEVAEAFRILKRPRGNIILNGPSGVGKTTILEGIAEMMVGEDVPANLQDKRLVVIDPGVLVAGASGLGGLEKRMVDIIYEVVLAGNVILVIEDIHHLLNAKSTGSVSVGEVLMNFLSQGYLQVIGTTTTKEYQEFIADKETFLRRFQTVKIEEMNLEEALQVLEAKSGIIGNKSSVYFSYEALEACVNLTDRYIQDRYLPAKALDILEESAVYTKETKGASTMVSKKEIAAVLSEKTNVQVSDITASEADKLLNLESIMHERIVGQDTAIEAIAKALRRAREDLRDQNRPISNLLFLGSTGVGKTETAKTIAEVYFGNESNMIRLDMSEYQNASSLSKMIGDQYNKGYLTENVRQKPFSIVLLDELEKAHPDILNLFLQVTEDGRLTDGQGKTIDFTNTIIIATSNAGTEFIAKSQKENLSEAEIEETLHEEILPKYFRPEFVNRFDRVVIFKALTQKETIEIARRLLNKLAKNLENKGFNFKATEEAIMELAEKGYSPKYGARPLRRLIQDTVDDSLAKLMLKQKINRRDTVILKPGGELEIKFAEKI